MIHAEQAQMLDLVEKDLEAAIMNMFKGLKKRNK